MHGLKHNKAGHYIGGLGYFYFCRCCYGFFCRRKNQQALFSITWHHLLFVCSDEWMGNNGDASIFGRFLKNR
jgi:hypothetical protein